MAPTKKELLEAMRTSRQAVKEQLSALQPADFLNPELDNGWTLKDLLAHLAAWQRFTILRLEAARSGKTPDMPPLHTDADVDVFNAQVYAENQHRPLPEVLEEFDAAFKALVALVEALDEAFIQGDLPQEWFGERPVHLIIAANAHWHEAEHFDI